LVDIGTFLSGITTVDLILVLYFMGFFVLGFAQGTIRRLIGIGAVLFSFFFAANIAEPLGNFLGANWTQFPKQYSYMVGFLTVFVAATVAFALVVQGFYKPQPLFEKARFVDELIGGFLGLIQAAIILGAIVIILDSYFRLTGIPKSPNELPLLRDLWSALDTSQIVKVFRETIIPVFLTVFGFLVPSSLRALYPLPS
jgi:uncharacterized membrane protein required for colicin V production